MTNPVRIVPPGEVSDPVRIVNLDELVTYLQENGIDLDVSTTIPNPLSVDLIGDVTGDLTGDVTGNVTGNVTGDLTGDVTGDLTGNSTGTHVESPTRWEDLRFPAQSINLSGAPAPPSVDNVGTALPGTLLFAGNQENNIAGMAQLPHAWKEGSAVYPHIHWGKPVADAGNALVDWEFRYCLSDKGGAWGAWSAWDNHTLILGSNTLAEQHNLSSFTAVDMTGLTVSCMLAWQIRRNGNTDAYAGLARLLEFDIHYQADALGSTQETVK